MLAGLSQLTSDGGGVAGASLCIDVVRRLARADRLKVAVMASYP
jgi:hypothetical protein